MDLGIAGKTALVSGASRGIGRACAELLTAEGVNVCGIARDESVLGTLESCGTGEVHRVAADLSTSDGCERAASACIEHFGTIDILVNNAGSAQQIPVLDATREILDDGLALKFHGYLRLAQLAAPFMIERRWGRIINIAGGAGTSPTATNLPTSIANAAVLNMTRSLSDVLAGHGVLVNVICPGLTRTHRGRRAKLEEARATGRDVDDLLDEVAKAFPAGRVAEPAEIARMVAFLASEPCSYVFASAIYMDGGVRRVTP